MSVRLLPSLTPIIRARGISTSLPRSNQKIHDLLNKFKDPNSLYHIPPGESGPSSPDSPSPPSSSSFASRNENPPSLSSSASSSTSSTHSASSPLRDEGGRGRAEYLALSDREARDHGMEVFRDAGYSMRGVLEWPVAWGDSDMFQHVNNVKILGYFESARIKFFESWSDLLPRDVVQDVLHGRNMGLILKDVTVRYRAPITYPDTVMIATKPHSISQSRASFNVNHLAYSLKDRRVVASADSTLVMYDYVAKRKGVMSDIMREALEQSARG